MVEKWRPVPPQLTCGTNGGPAATTACANAWSGWWPKPAWNGSASKTTTKSKVTPAGHQSNHLSTLNTISRDPFTTTFSVSLHVVRIPLRTAQQPVGEFVVEDDLPGAIPA